MTLQDKIEHHNINWKHLGPLGPGMSFLLAQPASDLGRWGGGPEPVMHAPTAAVGGAQILCDAASNFDPIVSHRTMYWLTSTALSFIHVPWNINGQFPFGFLYDFPNPLKDRILRPDWGTVMRLHLSPHPSSRASSR